MRTRTVALAGLAGGAGATAALVRRRQQNGGAQGAGHSARCGHAGHLGHSGHGVENPAPEPQVTPVPPLEGRLHTVVTEDGVTLHVEEHGPANATATLVLAHGYVQSSRLWAGQVRDVLAARPDLRVVVYDHRGHGRSGRATRETAHLEQLARDLVAVIDTVAPTGPVVLGGHSMGGMTIMALARQCPELFATRVAGVALISTAAAGLMPAVLRLGAHHPGCSVLRRLGATTPWLLEHAAADRRVRRLAACLHHRSRRAGLHGDHRCLAGLPQAGHARLRPRPAQPTGRPRPRRRPRRAAPRSPPGRLADQEVAAGAPIRARRKPPTCPAT